MCDPLSIPNTETNILDNKRNGSFKTPEKILNTMQLSRSSTNGSPTIIPLMKMTDPHLRRSMTSYNYTPSKNFEINSKLSSASSPYKTNQKRSSSLLSVQSPAISPSFLFSPSNNNSYRTNESSKRRKNDNSNNDNNHSDSHTIAISDPVYLQPKLSNKELLTMLKSNSFLKKRSKGYHDASLYKITPAKNDRNTQIEEKIMSPGTNTITTATTTIINNINSQKHNSEKYQTDDNKNIVTENKMSSTGDNGKSYIDRPLDINLILPFKYNHRTEDENNIRTPNNNISSKELSITHLSKETPTSPKNLNTLPIPIKIPILSKNGKATPHRLTKTPTALSPNFLLSNSKNKLTVNVNTLNKSVTKEQSKLSERNPLDDTINGSQNEEILNSRVFKTTPTKTYEKKTNYTNRETFQYPSNNANVLNSILKQSESPENKNNNTDLLSQVYITHPLEKELEATPSVRSIKDNTRDDNNTSLTEKQKDIDNSTITNDNSSKYTLHTTSQKISTVKLTPRKGVNIFEETQNIAKNVKITTPHNKNTSVSNINDINDKISSQLVIDGQNISFCDHIHNKNIDKGKIDMQNSQLKSTEVTKNDKNQSSNLKNQNLGERDAVNGKASTNIFHLDNNFSPLSNKSLSSIPKCGSHYSTMHDNLNKSENKEIKGSIIKTAFSDDLLYVHSDFFPAENICLLLQNKSDGIEKEEILKNKMTLKRKCALSKGLTEGKKNKILKVTSTNFQEKSPRLKHIADLKSQDNLPNIEKNESTTLRDNSQNINSSKDISESKWRQFSNHPSVTSVMAQPSSLNALPDIHHTSKKAYNTLTNLDDSINVCDMHISSNSAISSTRRLSYGDRRGVKRLTSNLKASVVNITPEMKVKSFDELSITPITNSMKMEAIYISDPDSDNKDKDNPKVGDKTSIDDGSDVEIFDNKYNSTQISEEAIFPSFLHNVDPHIERKKFEYGFTTLAYNKLKDKTRIPKETITDLICNGITKYTPLNKSDIVSVSNDICSSSNFQFSHTVFYQQLHKRDRIHCTSIDSYINASRLTGKYTILPTMTETKTIENEHSLSPKNNKTDFDKNKTWDKSLKEVTIQGENSCVTELNKDIVVPLSNIKQTSIHEEKIIADSKPEDYHTNIQNLSSSISNQTKSSRNIWRKVWLTNLEGCSVYFRNDNFFDNKTEKVKYVFIELFKCVPNVLLNSTVDLIILGKKESSSNSDQNTVLLEKYRFIMNKLAPGKKIRIWTYEKTIKFIQDMGINMKTIAANDSTVPLELNATKPNYKKINNNIDISLENNDKSIKHTIQNESTNITQKQQNTMQTVDNKAKFSKNNLNASDFVNFNKGNLTDAIHKSSDAPFDLIETNTQYNSNQNIKTINAEQEEEKKKLINKKEDTLFNPATKEEMLPKLFNESDKPLKWLQPQDTDLLSTLESGQKEFDNLQSSFINHSIFNIVNLMVNSLDQATDIIDKKSQELQTANKTIQALCSQILQQQYELASLHAVVETQKKHLTEEEKKKKELTVKWMQATVKNQTLELSKGKERENSIH